MSDGRLALVTGTSSGIGAAVARELLRHEWHVVGIARRTPAIEDERYRHLALDLADVPAATTAIERDFGARLGARAWERVGLVNNAAAAPAGRVQNLQVVDTEMQLAARSRPLEDFPWGGTFRRFHEEGRLVAPELPAADIVEFLDSSTTEQFKEGRYGT